jgi:hypothetical protein
MYFNCTISSGGPPITAHIIENLSGRRTKKPALHWMRTIIRMEVLDGALKR